MGGLRNLLAEGAGLEEAPGPVAAAFAFGELAQICMLFKWLLWAELGLRIDPTLRQSPVDETHPAVSITQEELQDKVIAFCTVSPLSAGPQHFASQKPLAGAVDHVGGKLLESTQAPGYLCLRAWLVPNDAKKLDPASDCAAAPATLGF